MEKRLDVAQAKPKKKRPNFGTNPHESISPRSCVDGGRRFGKERLGVDGDQHRYVAIAASKHRRNIGRSQEF